MNSSPGGFAAPPQLRCTTRQFPASGPFLQSPYGGWASINSFLDHDRPDYSVDGELILANGLRAASSSGLGSDVFPSYWSTDLRQYISYDGHNGYDYGISYQPVYAAAAGTIMFAGWNGSSQFQGYGQMVLINHHNGYVTLYGHLSSLEVSKGDTVRAGEEIGISGSTGNSSGPHLHFSVYHNCEVTDPYGWTGRGGDPLTSFDGEHASYLWLPGHDPLVLNTPPNWPAYPLGLRVGLSFGTATSRNGSRALPPVDRLLLLRLPAPSSDSGVSAPLALARTEDDVSQEALTLTPYLDRLEGHGLIVGYQVVPAAGAVWVRGTATSQELDSLPGVASMSGVAPADLRAAQSGLAHSVLIQLGQQQAPSLWPIGFRSALHPWRPVITAVSGHALVEGFTLPGQAVVVSVARSGAVPAAGQAMSDPQTGGFVVALEDETGRPFAVEPGDVVQVRSSGRQASVGVTTLRVHLHGRAVSGRARPGSTVPISIVARGTNKVWHAVATADGAGRFDARMPSELPGGSLAVASVTDGAGDEESASSHSSGLLIDLTHSTVTGWATTAEPDLQVWRSGRLVFRQSLRPSEDGVYHLVLRQVGNTLGLRAGDVLSVGSRWHRRRLVISSLSARLRAGSRTVFLSGLPDAHITATLAHRGTRSSLGVTLDGRGLFTLRSPSAESVGDSVTLQQILPTGDLLTASARLSGVVVHLGSSLIAGQTDPGETVSVTAYGSRGRTASLSTVSDFASGDFSGILRDSTGRRARLTPGTRLVVDDSLASVEATIPQLRVSLIGAHVLTVSAETRTLLLTLRGPGAKSWSELVHLGTQPSVSLRPPGLPGARSVVVTTAAADGVSFERTLRVRLRTTCRTSTRTVTCAATHTRVSRH